MNDLALSLLVSLVLTFPLVIIQLSADSKLHRLKFLFTSQLWLYFFISASGNIITTLIAASVLDHNLADTRRGAIDLQYLEGPHWVWYTFFGIFTFQALLKQVNLSIYGKGILAINDWSKKSQNAAVAASLKKATESVALETQGYASKLYGEFSSSDIHTIANNNMGSTAYNKMLRELASKPTLNFELHLCYLLATEYPLIIKGILAQK